MKEGLVVLTVLIVYGVLESNLMALYPNYPKISPAWLWRPFEILPEPIRFVLTMILVMDGAFGLGIAALVIVASIARLKYIWCWLAFTGFALALMYTILFTTRAHDLILNKGFWHALAQYGLFNAILIFLFAGPIYWYRSRNKNSSNN